MKFMLTKKDIIALNEQFDNGKLSNESSLDFAIGYARKTVNWVKALAYLVRAINLDHVFEEGNKRTAALLIKSYAEYEGFEIYPNKLTILIKDISTNKIKNIRKIEEKINEIIK